MATRIRELVTIGVLNVSILGACVSATPQLAKPNVDVRVGLITATTLAPILVAADDGEFAARGLNVSIQTVPDPSQAMLSVAQGQLEIGNITLAPAALNLLHQGGDLKIIAKAGHKTWSKGPSLSSLRNCQVWVLPHQPPAHSASFCSRPRESGRGCGDSFRPKGSRTGLYTTLYP